MMVLSCQTLWVGDALVPIRAVDNVVRVNSARLALSVEGRDVRCKLFRHSLG